MIQLENVFKFHKKTVVYRIQFNDFTQSQSAINAQKSSIRLKRLNTHLLTFIDNP